jgi:hypothetical protein
LVFEQFKCRMLPKDRSQKQLKMCSVFSSFRGTNF